MSQAAIDPELAKTSAAYAEFDRRLRIRYLLVADIVALICMPAGIGLDLFVYPVRLAEFFGIRMAVDAILLGIVLALALGRDRCSLGLVKALGILSTVVVNLSFCAMIFRTEGAASPYYAGINLVILIMATLLPWSAWETALVCGISLICYLIACIANPLFDEKAYSIFFNNSYFIVITTVICVTSTYFRSRARFEDFRLRHQLDAQNQKLQDLDRLKTQFFSNVSHELRTPLTLILGPVENLLVRGDSLDAKMHESLIFIHRNSLRLLKLINDLLDLTRIDQGAEVLRKKSVSMGAFVKGIVDSVRHLGLSKQLRIRVEEGRADAEMAADPARIEKVLINLLTNAVKFTPTGGIILVRWKADTVDSVIEVEDTGVGIPAEDLERVFDRFHQVRSNTTNQAQGVGIGLALAKELVEQHGGRIEVESKPGKGALFRISLPFERNLDSEFAQATLESSETEEPFEKAFRSADRAVRSVGAVADDDLPTIGNGKELVLVADDENEMRQFVVSLLADDYRVMQTSHGGNVRDLVAEHEPDLVLLDWMMPGKDGLEVCRELRADPGHRDLKIVLLTARIDEKSKLDALKSGADDFLTKPFSSIEVKTRVANLLSDARLQKDLRARNAELAASVEKLQRTELMLIQSEKMNAIGSLSAGLLHEINNPLNYTLTAISLVNRHQDSLSADMRELVGDIEEGMIRIRDVITHLKTFAYPETNDHKSLFPLSEALVDARKLCGKELLDIRIDVDLPETLIVRGQKTQLTHLFINLLGNAVFALSKLPAGQPKIISVRATLEDEMATVEVADSGPGISPDILNRVFEPFFTTRDVGSGMGMGLSICHTIMEAHDGTIRVGNRREGGAIFTIHIPIATQELKSC